MIPARHPLAPSALHVVPVLLVALPFAARAQSIQWLPAGSEPRARTTAVLAADPIDGRPLLFSGIAPSTLAAAQTYSADLWAWDGRSWLRRDVVGPSARHQFAMATDVWRRRVVLYGGDTPQGGHLDDTWEYDGTSWRRMTPGLAPGPSVGHCMAFDVLRGRTVLFGGAVTGTWEWNGTFWWRQQPPVEPPARVAAAMAYDPALGAVVLTGGRAGARVFVTFADSWSFDGATWTQLATAPAARSGHSMAYDPARGAIVAFGGDPQSAASADTWEFVGGAWVPRAPAVVPTPRSGTAMAFDPVQRRTLLTGAEELPTGGYVATTWTWDGTTWARQPQPQAPAERRLHGFVDDAMPRAMLLFGGHAGLQYQGDTWRWQGGGWQRLQPANAPSPRASFALARDTLRNRVVLFGGDSTPAQPALGDTWEWDGANWSPVATPVAPPPRTRAAMTFDAQRGACVLFGGTDLQQLFGDTWTWDGTTWTLAATTGPSPRSSTAMAFDAARGDVVLFGGTTAGTVLRPADTWLWNGTAWAQAQPAASPAGRAFHTMAFDARRGRVVLHGGQVPLWDGETWEWDGTTWTRVWQAAPEDLCPASCHTTAMAYEPVRAAALLFDGSDVWVRTDRAATVASYGTACGTAPRLRTNDRPFLGARAFAFELDAATPAVLFGLFVGAAPANVPLPNGCTLLLAQPALGGLGVTSLGGTASQRLAIPAAASLQGATLFVQAGVLDTPGTFSLSQGLRVTAGD